MTTKRFLVPNTRALWSSGRSDGGRRLCARRQRSSFILILFTFLSAACVTPTRAQTLADLVATHKEKPTAGTTAALERFANAHSGDTDGALALLALGAEQAATDDYEKAIERLSAAAPRLEKLGDYTAYHLAVGLHRQMRYDEAIASLSQVLGLEPASPFQADAAVLAGRVYLESGNPAAAEKLLRSYVGILPQPAGLALLGEAQEASGSLSAAAGSFQRVYYEYPASLEARQADLALSRLRRKLGRAYPRPAAQAMFLRVDGLIRAGQELTARKELQTMTTTLSGADRDRARVWLGKARYLRDHNTVAYRWLKDLKVTDPEADAERLYYLLASARRLDRNSEVVSIAAELGRRYPDSDWRLEALVSAGNMFLLVNDHERFVPLYRECAEAFPEHEDAEYCSWKVAWSHYIRRHPQAEQLLRTYLEKYPESEKASAALYFLGRLAEKRNDRSAAFSYYRELEHEYPNWYYAFRARDRLSAMDTAGTESEEVKKFLAAINFPERRHQKNFDATPVTKARLERARLLLGAGLRDWGERELRHGVRTGAQGPILAMELARSAAGAGDYGKSLRYIKGLAPGYLSMPLEDAPREFWEFTFPLAYRNTLEKYARRSGVDVYFLAALIRQESEFDTRAVSRARAYGLTQVLPSTGRLLARQLGIRGFRTASLYNPEINVNMGTYYLRDLIDSLEGHTEAALAAYNAGKSRAVRWLTWGEFEEPSEFVETIPFTETRTYVQMVLRNADVYRRLYGG